MRQGLQTAWFARRADIKPLKTNAQLFQTKAARTPMPLFLNCHSVFGHTNLNAHSSQI